MFCNKCGAHNAEDATVCTICNNSFVTVNESINEMPVAAGNAVVKPPKSYFFSSLFLSIFGSVPFGVVALVLSVMVDVNLEAENIELAQKYSKKCKLFCFISLFVGIVKYYSVILWMLIIRNYFG